MLKRLALVAALLALPFLTAPADAASCRARSGTVRIDSTATLVNQVSFHSSTTRSGPVFMPGPITAFECNTLVDTVLYITSRSATDAQVTLQFRDANRNILAQPVKSIPAFGFLIVSTQAEISQ